MDKFRYKEIRKSSQALTGQDDFIINNACNGKSIIFKTTNGTASSDNVEQMRIDKSGNVGIGTANPDVKLSVYDGSNQLCKLFKEAGTNASILQLGYNGNPGTGYGPEGPGTGDLTLGTSTKIQFGGPGGDLAYSLCEIICKKYANDEESELLLFKGNDHNDRIRLRAPHIRFDTYKDCSNDANLVTTKMIIDTDGNVGIGTINPGAKLHVVGDVKVSGSISGDITGNAASVNDGVYLSTSQTITGAKTFENDVKIKGREGILILEDDNLNGHSYIEYKLNNSRKGYIGIPQDGSKKISIVNDFGNSGLIDLQNGGLVVKCDTNKNVGIGTGTPVNKLHVEGSASVRDTLNFKFGDTDKICFTDPNTPGGAGSGSATNYSKIRHETGWRE